MKKPMAVASVALIFGGLVLAGYSRVARAQAAPVPLEPAAASRAVLSRYCVSCHNGKLSTAGLNLEALDVAHIGDHAEVWEKVATKFRTHEMPPPGRPRPDSATYAAVTVHLERELDAAGAARPNPGHVPLHRLNRTEYANAIRDLLALKIDGESLLVADEPDKQGFENIASLLSVSPVRLERYLSAARKISRLAIGDSTLNPVVETYAIHPALVQDDRVSEDLPFGTQGGIAIDHLFPIDAEYSIKILLKRQVYEYIQGMGEAHQIDVRIDGVRVKRFSVGGEGKGMTAPESYAGNTQGDPAWEEYMHTADAHLELKMPVKAGLRKVGVSFVRQYWEREGILSPRQTGYAVVTNDNYFESPSVERVLIGGPYSGAASVSADTPSRRRVFSCRPKDRAGEEPCARQILSALATRAYRRPVTREDLEILLSFYRSGHAGGGFEAGIQRGLERILAAPSFLFRVERQPSEVAGSLYRLSDLELASRLSFFLWSSLPDDELIDLGARGRLRDPAVMERQVKRMLADPRATALVDNFASQWLNLGKIAGAKPDEYAYPEFDENLRGAMLEETKQFISSQIREDRSVVDLLSADYTFVNERLARHYGIPDVLGNRFRRVAFKDGVRGGLLGQASILTVTSYPNRTSPVVRGKWLLENMLGAPPPPPPPDVPTLVENTGAAQPKSVRERLEAHRKNPSCAACHVRMDPLGFSLENFDGLGKWRTTSDGVPIDASASLPDGTAFEGVVGLRKLLLDERDEFVRTLTEKLLSYALGRGLEHFDLPTVRRIAREAESADQRWSALVFGIVRSMPFTMGTVSGETSEGIPAERRTAQVTRRPVK